MYGHFPERFYHTVHILTKSGYYFVKFYSNQFSTLTFLTKITFNLILNCSRHSI